MRSLFGVPLPVLPGKIGWLVRGAALALGLLLLAPSPEQAALALADSAQPFWRGLGLEWLRTHPPATPLSPAVVYRLTGRAPAPAESPGQERDSGIVLGRVEWSPWRVPAEGRPQALLPDRWRTREVPLGGEVVIVVDGSASLAPRARELRRLLRGRRVLLGRDVPREVEAENLTFQGGQDNLAALEAACRLRPAAILWIHGSQPVSLGSTRTLRRLLGGAGAPQLVHCGEGPHRVVGQLEGRELPWSAVEGWLRTPTRVQVDFYHHGPLGTVRNVYHSFHRRHEDCGYRLRPAGEREWWV